MTQDQHYVVPGESAGGLGGAAGNGCQWPVAMLAEAIVVVDPEGKLLYASKAAERLLEKPADECQGRPVDEVMSLSPISPESTTDALSSSHEADPQRVREAVLSTASGTRRYVEYTSSQVEGGPCVYLIRDVTQRLQIAEQQALLERLNALGSVIAGVAHETNNPLAFALGNLELAQRLCGTLKNSVSPALGSTLARLQEAINTATQGARRVAEIVNDLRTFARTSRDEIRLVQLHESLEAAVRLSMHEIRHRARIVRETYAHPTVRSSERKLSQVFVNLLINAALAIEPGSPDGTIRIVIDTNDKGEAVVEIGHNGAAIDPQRLSRVFDPLVSTMPAAQGSGLGLSVCHRIVESLGGRIEVRSEPRATSFRVVFPGPGRLQDEVSVSPATDLAVRRQRLLIVDDEPALVAVYSELLSEEGYEVESASDGAKALTLLGARPPFDAVLCDMMMPVMDGIDLYQRTLEVAPELAERFVFMTGGTTTDRGAAFLKSTRQPWVSKPIQFDKLVGALRGLQAPKAPD